MIFSVDENHHRYSLRIAINSTSNNLTVIIIICDVIFRLSFVGAVSFSFTKYISIFLQVIKITLNQLDLNLGLSSFFFPFPFFFLSADDHVHHSRFRKWNWKIRCFLCRLHHHYERIFKCFYCVNYSKMKNKISETMCNASVCHSAFERFFLSSAYIGLWFRVSVENRKILTIYRNVSFCLFRCACGCVHVLPAARNVDDNNLILENWLVALEMSGRCFSLRFTILFMGLRESTCKIQ